MMGAVTMMRMLFVSILRECESDGNAGHRTAEVWLQ